MKNLNGILIGSFLFFGIFLPSAKFLGIPLYGLFALLCLIFSSTIFTGFTRQQLHYTFIIIFLTAILVGISLYHDHTYLQSIFGCSVITILGIFFKSDKKTLTVALTLFKVSLIFISTLTFLQFSGDMNAKLLPLTVFSLFQIPLSEEMIIDIYNYPTGISGVAHIFYYGLAVSLVILIYEYLYLSENKSLFSFSGICLLAVLTAVIICGQRSSILGLVMGFMLFFAFDSNRNSSFSLVWVTSAAAIFILLLSSTFSSEFLYRFDYKYSDFFGSRSDELRLESIYAGIDVFMKHPLFGAPASAISTVLAPHNGIINGFTKFGIFYLFVVAFYILISINLLRDTRFAYVVLMVFLITTMTHSSIPFYNDIVGAMCLFSLFLFQDVNKEITQKAG